jgi:glycerophosphoryl diester phosphodiesterase
MSEIFVWAHRGASALAPENTLAAFRAAEAAGADGLELDVQLSRDGVPMVLHDETLDRTSDGRGPVAERPLEQLKRLDAGSWFSADFAGEKIPTLQEALHWGGSRLRFNIEIKDSAAGQAVLELSRSYAQASIVVSSFDHDLLQRLRCAAPNLPLAFLGGNPDWVTAVERAAACAAESFNPRYDYLSAEMVIDCHRRGLAVYPWTVDAVAELKHCRRLGVDGVFCNNPGQVLAWLQRRDNGDRSIRF